MQKHTAKMKSTRKLGKENLDRKSQPWKSQRLVNGQRMVNNQRMKPQDDVEMTLADQWMLMQLGLTWQR